MDMLLHAVQKEMNGYLMVVIQNTHLKWSSPMKKAFTIFLAKHYWEEGPEELIDAAQMAGLKVGEE